MSYEIGYVDNLGSEGLAHWQLLAKIKALGEANGWTTLRYTTPVDGSNRELIMRGVGLSGDKQIFVGFRTYHLTTGDYYNLSVAGFTGYVGANAFTAQPGYVEHGLCGHNQRIDYWIAVNAQRFLLGLKVGTPVYEIGYTGFYFPYATPGQLPYPLAVAGTLAGVPATRYSDTGGGHSSGVKGNLTQSMLRDVAGVWQTFLCLPWTADYNAAPAIRRDTGGYYNLQKCVLLTPGNVWGELDGIRYISGFNNITENTVVIGGVTHVVLQDVFRTGIGDYFLLEMS